MKELIKLLHEGNCSCVLYLDGKNSTYHRRGVIDLYTLLKETPEALRGALLADKVIGKGAAAVIATGGISEVYADVISIPARQLLCDAGIKVTYAELVSAIRDRKGTGWCPLETACREASTAAEAMPLVEAFVEKMLSENIIIDKKQS